MALPKQAVTLAATVVAGGTATTRPGSRVAVGPLGLMSVASLLAWVFEFGQFSTWFWRVSLPATITLAVPAAVATRDRRRAALVAGVGGGLLGTAG